MLTSVLGSTADTRFVASSKALELTNGCHCVGKDNVHKGSAATKGILGQRCRRRVHDNMPSRVWRHLALWVEAAISVLSEQPDHHHHTCSKHRAGRHRACCHGRFVADALARVEDVLRLSTRRCRDHHCRQFGLART